MASSSSFQRGERRGRWGSPERTVVWTEPKAKAKAARKVAVVYYLCHRDGHLDHPHFLEMELPRSSHPAAPAAGLYLRDFTARLNALRGNGMTSMYSWSSKRSYRNGYVWQDLTDDDLILPAHGNDEYVLKGSPLVVFPQPPPPHQGASSFSQDKRGAGPGRHHRKNWSSFDLGDCNNKLMVAQHSSAATQTDHHGGPDPSTELTIHEISPPPSSGSPDDALESCSREVGVIAGGRMRVSAVLMQIISCGSMTAVKRRGHARTRSDMVIASASNRQAETKEVDAYASVARADECLSVSGGAAGVVVEWDYFSGSLVESSKKRSGGDDALLLKRSSSCNAAGRGAAAQAEAAGAGEGGPWRPAGAGCLASRGRRAPKRNMTKSTAAARSRDGGECKGPTATADGHGTAGR